MDYERAWKELRAMLEEDAEAVPSRPGRSSAVEAAESRKFHSQRYLALMEQLESE